MSKATKKKAAVEVGKPTAGDWDGTHPVMRTDKSNGYIPIFCHIPGGGDPLIGHVWAHLESRDPEYRANALAIGAAPELLAVCQEVEKAVKATGDYIGQDGQLIKRLRAAIAKATQL